MRLDLKNNKQMQLNSGQYSDAVTVLEEKGLAEFLTVEGQRKKYRIAQVDNERIGFYLITNFTERGKSIGEISFVYVHPSERGQKYGSILTSSAALEVAADSGAEFLHCGAGINKQSTGHIFEKLGFKPAVASLFSIPLEERDAVRKIFQDYLRENLK